MQDTLKIARIQILVLVLFVIFKFSRASVMEQGPPEWVEVFFWSFPNFCEAIIGVLTLTLIGLTAQRYLQIRNGTVYIFAIILAAIYVLTQEFKIHNLGGNNIYDPNDVLFSVFGLVAGALILFRLKPEMRRLHSDS